MSHRDGLHEERKGNDERMEDKRDKHQICKFFTLTVME